MKILDKYIAKSFLTGYVIAFCVLMGLRMIIDVFVNLDEFTENANLGAMAVIWNILTYYALRSTLYFRDFAGMIIVVAAAFSLGKMVRYNELTAMMASGVSLKRVIAPIVILSTLLTALLIVDQEIIIPPLSDKLVRGPDAVPGRERYDVWFITDANGALICSQSFDVGTATLKQPVIITRYRKPDSAIWEPTGYIDAEAAKYDTHSGAWQLSKGRFTPIVSVGRDAGDSAEQPASLSPRPITSFLTDIMPRDIPVRRKAEHKALLSFRQLSALERQGTKVKDLADLASQKHFRVTDPILSLIMLMVCLPTLVCRDPKAMKSAIAVSFAITTACLVVGFFCKLLAGEELFGIAAQFWAWLPVFIFAPVAFIQLDSMKT